MDRQKLPPDRFRFCEEPPSAVYVCRVRKSTKKNCDQKKIEKKNIGRNGWNERQSGEHLPEGWKAPTASRPTLSEIHARESALLCLTAATAMDFGTRDGLQGIPELCSRDPYLCRGRTLSWETCTVNGTFTFILAISFSFFFIKRQKSDAKRMERWSVAKPRENCAAACRNREKVSSFYGTAQSFYNSPLTLSRYTPPSCSTSRRFEISMWLYVRWKTT